MERLWSWVGREGPSGFGACSTAEEVIEGIDASNVTAIVTGATSGLGMETARVLALRGATVIIPARSKESGEKAKKKIVEQVADAKIQVMELDLSSLASVRSFAAAFLSSYKPLNLLINNVGIYGVPFQLSKDGIDLQFATNHIGHFLLTNLLLEKMKATAWKSGNRRKNRDRGIGSPQNLQIFLRFEKINNHSGYRPFYAYGESKLANILHAKELARRLQEERAQVTVNSLHPEVIPTNIMRSTKYLVVGASMVSFFLKNAQQGAATTCYLAVHKGEEIF